LGGAVTAAVHRVLASPGESLDTETRGYFEPRFGHDFGRVRVHADSEAGASARSVNAWAYTVGSDLVFGHGRFAPSSAGGRRLIAHELAHVVQQDGAEGMDGGGAMGVSHAVQEREADQAASRVLGGQMPSKPGKTGKLALARFGDPTHHVIEEAALPGAGFAPDQVRSIERGNIQRDYSQVGAVGNAALLGDAKAYGGYDTAEHFDNFIFDAVTDRWRTRGSGNQKFLHLDPREVDTSPVDYISGQLAELASAGMNENSLVHLGNAFHTVEDFFAHSNFIELTHNDPRFGGDLLTGSFGDNPANSAVSLAHTLGAVSTPAMQGYYERQAEAQTELTEPKSHSRLAKDTAASPGFAEARRLAALVIQELGAEVITVMRNPRPDARVRLMNETVVGKIRTYLRPPDPKNPWWEGLVSRGGASMDTRLAEAESRTPVTVNQWAFSPLRNLEASKDSSMAIPLGAAVPLGRQSWFQVGAGVTRPPSLDPRLPQPPDPRDERSSPFVGAQITGHF
jgi:hypothetical protein